MRRTRRVKIVATLGPASNTPQMMRALAEYLSLAVNSVTTIVDGLEQKDLIRRQRSDEDRRIVRVELSELGREAFEASEAAKMQLFRSMLSPLTVDEQEILLVLFRKIARGGRTPVAAAADDER
jgi:DNA-binding MarR family transcriptional regulator